MPRSGRGGQRQLVPGKVSATRTDLNARQPIRVAPGGTYGAGVASADAQRAVPLPQSTLPSQTAAPEAVPMTAPPGADRPLPPALLSPSNRPGEPVTAGAPLGPGPGPEALGLPAGPSLSQRLRQMATVSNSPSLTALADRAEALGQ